jgi:hypothetical protein
MTSAQEAKEIVNQMNAALRVIILPLEELRHHCTEKCLRAVGIEPVTCSLVNAEGCECGREAVVQLLPSGDESRCQHHIQKGAQSCV